MKTTNEKHEGFNIISANMKTIIQVDGKTIFRDNNISRKRLDEVVKTMKERYGVNTMREIVRRGFNVYTF